jgi:GntR family transcriptional regulator
MIQSEFRRVADDIAAKINAGLLQPGQQLPSYRDLAAEYEVGISTIRMALVLLGERGLTIGRPGKGTFVADRLGGS